MRTPTRKVLASGEVCFKVRYRRLDGTQSSVTFYGDTALEDAEEWAYVLKKFGVARALRYLDAHDDRERKPPVTVRQLWDRWFEWKSARRADGSLLRVRSSRTLDDYARMWAKWIEPTFADMPVHLVSAVDVQDWIDKLSLELDPKTVADYHSILSAMFKWGVHPTRGVVEINPCLETQLPARRRKQPKGFRPDEWPLLLQAAVDVDPDAADLILFMTSTGWRWSEAIAAQVMAVRHWVAFEEQNGLQVEVSYTYVTMGRVLRRGAKGEGYEFAEDGKSDAAQRTVRLVGAAEEMILRRCAGRAADDLIFTTRTGRRWVYSLFHQRIWTRPAEGSKTRDYAPRKPRILEVAAELGLERAGDPDPKKRPTPHWLRHTQAAFLILAGEPLTAIQRRMGHASIKTTSDVYGRMIEDASAAGLDRASLMLGAMPERRPVEGPPRRRALDS